LADLGGLMFLAPVTPDEYGERWTDSQSVADVLNRPSSSQENVR